MGWAEVATAAVAVGRLERLSPYDFLFPPAFPRLLMVSAGQYPVVSSPSPGRHASLNSLNSLSLHITHFTPYGMAALGELPMSRNSTERNNYYLAFFDHTRPQLRFPSSNSASLNTVRSIRAAHCPSRMAKLSSPQQSRPRVPGARGEPPPRRDGCGGVAAHRPCEGRLKICRRSNSRLGHCHWRRGGGRCGRRS